MDAVQQLPASHLAFKKAKQEERRRTIEADLVRRVQEARGEASDKPLSPKLKPARKFPLELTPLWIVSSPFQQGTPNPVFQWNAVTNQPPTDGFITLQALAEPDSGRMSLGLMGGNGGGGFGSTSLRSTPMPERWPFGDKTSVSASITVLHDLDTLPTAGSSLIVTSSIFNPMLAGKLNSALGALDVLPGLATSEGQGWVAAIGSVTVTASVRLGTTVQAMNSEYLVFLDRVAIRTDPSENQYESPGKILSDEWLFGAAPNQIVEATMTIPLAAQDGVRLSVLVETEIEIAAFRIGVNAPNAGGISMAFQTIGSGLPGLGSVPGTPCPFELVSVSASLLQL